MAQGSHPAAAVQLYNKGAEHFRNGELDQAIEFFKKSGEADGNFFRAHAYLGMLDDGVQVFLGRRLLEPADGRPRLGRHQQHAVFELGVRFPHLGPQTGTVLLGNGS